jgi:hypothetical protein
MREEVYDRREALVFVGKFARKWLLLLLLCLCLCLCDFSSSTQFAPSLSHYFLPL